MNDCITTTKQSTTKPCAYFLGYTVVHAELVNTGTGKGGVYVIFMMVSFHALHVK